MVMVKIKKKPKQTCFGRNQVWIVTVILTTLVYFLLMCNEKVSETEENALAHATFRKKSSSFLEKMPPLDPHVYLPELKGKQPLPVTRRQDQRSEAPPADTVGELNTGEGSHSPSSYSLAVMVDASLDYFPLPFLERLLDYMVLLQNYDTLHLRLTGDVNFLYKSNSHPELATASSSKPYFYTSRQLQQVLRYASKRGISIIPEISIPYPAGAWGAEYVVPCPVYACQVGHDMPLDLSNPNLLEIVQDLLGELVGLGFGTIHLGGHSPGGGSGGDGLKHHECYLEAGLDGDAVQLMWEQQLIEMILPDVPISPENIVRWSGGDTETSDVGVDYSSLGYSVMYRPRGDGDTPLSETPRHRDSDWYTLNGSESVLDLFAAAQKQSTVTEAAGIKNILLSTEGVRLEEWEGMALWTKMVAVAMGVSNEFGPEDFFGSFQQTCYGVLDDHMCSMTATGAQRQQKKDASRTEKHRVLVCENLTEIAEVFILRPPQEPVGDELERARKIFKERNDSGKQKRDMPSVFYDHNEFGNIRASTESYPLGRPQRHDKALLPPHKLGYTGITVDTTRYFFPLARLQSLLDHMSRLGFNTLHLRLTDDYAFAARFRTHPNLAFAAKKNGPVYTVDDFHELVRYAHKHGIEIIPEVNILSRAGGWFESGLLVQCPHFACDVACGMPLDLSSSNVHGLAIIVNVLDEIRSIFNSPFLHLGYDERLESQICYKEAKMNLPSGREQDTAAAIMKMLGIPLEHVMRWESSEMEAQDDNNIRERTGRVTHYYRSNPSTEDLKGLKNAVMLSTDSFNFASPTESDGYTIYKQMFEVSQQENVLGVLAGTLEMGPAMWNGRNVEGKLVAMAMGAAATELVSREDFEKAFRQTCKGLEMDGDSVVSFGKSRWSDKEFGRHMNEDRKTRKELMCSRTTTMAEQRIAKRRKGS